MEWKIITREIIDNKNNITIVETSQQIDEVGNIYQIHGGIIPKACQKCKEPFDSEVKAFPLTQKIPYYKCEDCEFENTGGEATLDHKIETSHNIKKSTKDRIVSLENKIVGNKANIEHTEDDIIIICDRCNGF